MSPAPNLTCPLCDRAGAPMERHHLKTRRKDKSDIELICRECHHQIHALFEQYELRNPILELDSIEGLLKNDKMQKAVKFIQKIQPGQRAKVKKSKR